MTDGQRFWLRVLGPLARDGFRKGEFDDAEVVLVNDAGAEIRLARPSASWHPPLLPASDAKDEDTEARVRGVRWLMKVGDERYEVSA